MKASEPYLRPGESIQTVFFGQTANPFIGALAVIPVLGLIGALIVSAAGGNRLRIFVVTTQRILVLDGNPMRPKKLADVVAELPRSIRLGPPSGLWYKIPVDGKRVRVHRRRFDGIREADRLAPSLATDR